MHGFNETEWEFGQVEFAQRKTFFFLNKKFNWTVHSSFVPSGSMASPYDDR